MKRSGRKSAAQTPAPKSERIKGSKRNPKGSAASSESANKINLSDNILQVLKDKADAYNEKHPKNKVSVSTLKAVFRRGAGAYSSSHRPTITGGRPNSRTAWAYARVNKFLLKKGGTKVKAAYVQDDDLMEKGGQLSKEITCVNCGWHWNTEQSDELNKYICHKCGFDNRTYYDSDPIGKYHLGGDMSKHLAPNGKPSNLTHELWHLVRTPEFKAWFGDWENDPQNASKVIDENGEPLVVYHYARRLQYELDKFFVFKTTKQLGSHFGSLSQISNLSSDAKYKIDKNELDFKFYQVFLNIRNPIRMGDTPYWENQDLLNALNRKYNIFENKAWQYGEKSAKYYTEKYGIDGIVYLNRYETKNQLIHSQEEKLTDEEFKELVPSAEDSWIAFNPNEIKLADGSNTTFDGNNPDIRYEDGGKLDDGKENFGKPIGFETNLFIHETNNIDAKSIIKNGFKPNKNPVIINGIYTLPKDWKEGYIGRGEVDLDIKLKKGSKIFWTDTDRPIDADLGYGNKFYEQLYQKLVKNIAKSPKEAIYVNNETWFEAKTKFNREIENWLKENKYCGIQRGGEIVITEPSCIDSITISKDMFKDGGEMQQNIALPDTYSTFDKLKPILANQGYELNKIGDNNFAEGGLMKPTMSVAQIAKKHGKKESYIEKQLEIGTKHELEHSYSEELAKKTALHHLADMADYYTRLKKMELQQEAEKLTNYYADGGVTDYGTCEVLDDDGERMIDEKSIKQLTECVMNLPQTKSFHIDFETSQYKPYRRRLHKDIIYQIKKDLICVEREEPIAILLGGSPASGKSTFLKRYAPYLLSDEILKIDADEIRAKLPEYRGYNAAQTHLETKDIVTTLLSDRNIGIPCTFDVIYDGTMNNTKSYAPLIQLLKSLGYKVFIIYIDKVPKNVAIERALKRYQNSGRFVPVEVIEDFFTKGKTALNELKSSVDGYMIVDGSDKNYHVIERGGIKIPQNRSYSNIGSPIQITTEDVVREFAKGGQVGMQGNIKHSSGAAGGYLVGKRHSEGGIKAINKSTNQPLEMEGGEVVITRNAVSDSEKREFEGEMLTNREILSRINQSGGGVSFEKGGQTDYKCACNGKKYAYGGKVLSDYEIVNQINGLYPSSGIMTFSEYKDQFNKEASTKDYFNHLQKTGVDASSITFTERAKLLTY